MTLPAYVSDPSLNRFDAAGFIGHRKLHDIGNDQWAYEFENGYGASVIRGPYSYGGSSGFFEVAVCHGESQELCYRTEVTSDVIGWLDEAGVLKTLDAIRNLPVNNECDHKSRGSTYGSGLDEGEQANSGWISRVYAFEETPRSRAARELREAEAETIADVVSALFTFLIILAAFVSVCLWAGAEGVLA